MCIGKLRINNGFQMNVWLHYALDHQRRAAANTEGV